MSVNMNMAISIFFEIIKILLSPLICAIFLIILKLWIKKEFDKKLELIKAHYKTISDVETKIVLYSHEQLKSIWSLLLQLESLFTENIGENSNINTANDTYSLLSKMIENILPYLKTENDKVYNLISNDLNVKFTNGVDYIMFHLNNYDNYNIKKNILKNYIEMETLLWTLN